jgi:hypothetical protein
VLSVIKLVYSCAVPPLAQLGQHGLRLLLVEPRHLLLQCSPCCCSQADVVPVDEAAKEGEQAAAPSPAVQPAAAAAAPGMYAYNYTAADQAAAAAAGGAVDPAMLAYQQQAGLVQGQQWAAGGLPDGAADGQQ